MNGFQMERIGKKQGSFWDGVIIVLGTTLLALGIYCFTAPNQIAPGGVSGLSTLIHDLTDLPLGFLSGVFNLPLLWLGYRHLGKAFFYKTLLSVVSFTVIYDRVLPVMPVYQGDPILAALFGGVVMGTGIGITFLCDGSTGGLDISSKVIQQKYPHIKIGTVVFLSDLVIIGVAALVYRDVTTAMYALIAMFVSTRMIDTVLYGMDLGKMVWIVTQKGDELAEVLLRETHRGVTKIPTVGAYTGKENQTLLCAVRQNQYHQLKTIVMRTDPEAFLIVATATEVVGEGFRSNGGTLT